MEQQGDESTPECLVSNCGALKVIGEEQDPLSRTVTHWVGDG